MTRATRFQLCLMTAFLVAVGLCWLMAKCAGVV